MRTAFDAGWELELIQATASCAETPDAIKALETVKPDWFMLDFHRKVWVVMMACYRDLGQLDYLEIRTRLMAASWPEAERIQALDMMSTVWQLPFMASDVRRTIKAARECHMRRETVKHLAAITRRLEDVSQPLDGSLAATTEALAFIQADAAGHEMQARDFTEEVERYLSGEPLQPSEKMQMVSFGIRDIDSELMAGPGSLGVMAAKTSAGKTSLAIQGAIETALAGHKPAIFSLEMSDEELAARFIANITGTFSGKVARGTGSQMTGKKSLLELAKSVKKVCRIPGKRFESVASKIRELRLRDGVDVVFVDYFTLLNPPDLKNKSASTAFQLGEMSKGFKQLASDLGIAIILLSQFNRGIQDGQRPDLENLRETGQLEQDANWILMMWTDKKDYKPEEDRLVWMELQKNRGGKRWVKASASFEPATGRFGKKEMVNQSTEEPAYDAWAGFPQ